MGDNSRAYTASLCHDCKVRNTIHMNGKNDIEVDCSLCGDNLKPKVKCAEAVM